MAVFQKELISYGASVFRPVAVTMARGISEGAIISPLRGMLGAGARYIVIVEACDLEHAIATMGRPRAENQVVRVRKSFSYVTPDAADKMPYRVRRTQCARYPFLGDIFIRCMPRAHRYACWRNCNMPHAQRLYYVSKKSR